MNKITNSCPSSSVNVWKVIVNGAGYLITPAHVALYEKEKNWRLSPLLKDFHDYNWNIPYSYVIKPSAQSDICWAKVPNDNDLSNFLELERTEIEEPLNVDVVFRQPYDIHGINVGIKSTIGSTKATLYKSPSDGLIESLDIGFRGMSGAIAISAETKVVGIFVVRGSLIDFKKSSNVSHSFSNKFNYAATTSFEKYLCDEIRQLKFELEDMRKIALTKDDVKELGVTFDARRGIFLPSNTILRTICGMESICVNDIIGKRVPTS